MPRRPDMLNVRSQLDYATTIFEGLQKYGMCPALDSEIRKWLIINRAIIRKHDAKRKAGNRHDLYVTRDVPEEMP